MAKRQRGPATDVERILNKLSEQARQDFAEFVNDGRTLLDLQQWFKERGHHVSTNSLSTWRRNHRAIGDRAQAAMAVLERCNTVDPRRVLQFCAITSTLLVEDLQVRLNAEWSRNDVLGLLAALREARSAASELASLEVKLDAVENQLSGVYEVCSRVMTAAKDNPNREWVEHLLDFAAKGIEADIKAQQLGQMVGS